MRSPPWPTGLQAFQGDRGRADWPGPEELLARSRWSGIRLRTRERTHRDTHPQIHSFPPSPPNYAAQRTYTGSQRRTPATPAWAHQRAAPLESRDTYPPHGAADAGLCGQRYAHTYMHTQPTGLRTRASAAKDTHTHTCTHSPRGCGRGHLWPKIYAHTPWGCRRGHLRPKTHTHTLGAVDASLCGQRYAHTYMHTHPTGLQTWASAAKDTHTQVTVVLGTLLSQLAGGTLARSP